MLLSVIQSVVSFVLLLVRLLLFLRVVGVFQHRLDVAANESHKHWGAEAGRNEVEKSWLGVLVPVHDEDGESESGDVGDERRVEVEVRVAVQRPVVTEQEGDEDSRNDDVTEAEHGHVLGVEAVLEQVLREDEFDGSLERLGDGDHDVGAEDPEDVVEEETAEQDAAGHDVVQVEQLDAVDGEGEAEQVVGDPVLLHEIPDADDGADSQDDEVVGGEVVADDFSLGRVVPGTFRQPEVEVVQRDQACRNVLRDETLDDE